MSLFSDAPAIKSVQRGEETLSVSAFGTIAINQVDLNKSLLLFTYSNNGTTSSAIPCVWLSSSTQITYDLSSSVSGTIRWYVLEFARGVRVQHIRQTSASSPVAINKVDITKSFITTSYEGDSVGGAGLAVLDSSGESFSVTDPLGDAASRRAFQVIEWNGAKVQVVDTGTFSTASRNETINAVDLQKTVLFGSMDHAADANNAISIAHLSSSTNLQFNKSTSGSNERHVVYIVEIPEFNVQSGRKFIANGTASTAETINSVFYSHAFPVVSNRGDMITQGASSVYRTDRGAYDLGLSGTALTFTRSSGTDDTYVPWFVVEYKERLAIRQIQRPVSTGVLGNGTVSDNLSVNEYTAEKSMHYAWSDDLRGSSWKVGPVCSRLIDSTTVQVRIGDGTGATTESAEVNLIEFDTGLTAQHFLDPGGARPDTVSINTVDTSHAVIMSQYVDGTGDNLEDHKLQELTFSDSSTVQIADNANSLNSTVSGIQVLEFHDAHTRTADGDAVTGVDNNIAINRLDPEKTILFGSSQVNSTANVDCDEFKQWIINLTDNVNLIAGVSRSQDITVYPVMIDGPSGVKVQHVSFTDIGTATSIDITIDEVSLDRTFVLFRSYNYNTGYVAGTLGDPDQDADQVCFKAELINSTTLRVTRKGSVDADIGGYLSVVEVNSYPITKFKRKCKLTIQGSKVAATGTYPVHLQYDGSDATRTNLPSEMFDADGDHPSQSNGGDIRVTSDAEGTTLLPLEIVYWKTDNNTANARGDAWVRVSLTASTDKDIYIWWDAPGNVQQPSPYLDEGAYQVWPTSEYAFVCHCSEFDVSTTGRGYWDSTEYGATPSVIDAGFSSRLEDSPCGTSIEGAGDSGQTIQFAHRAVIQDIRNSDYTAYLIMGTSVGFVYGEPFAIGQENSNASLNNGLIACDRETSDDSMIVFFGDSDGSDLVINAGANSFPDNTETFFAVGMTSSNVPFVSSNAGTRVTGTFGGGSPSTPSNAGAITMFNVHDSATPSWDGTISEAIIRTEEGGADWDTTLYNTMMDPDGFVSPGTPESAWEHSTPITNGLLIQYDPSYANSVKLDSGKVNYIRDIVNNFNLYKDSDYSSPSIISNRGDWNRLDIINFDESNSECLALPWLPISGSQARTLFVVAKTIRTGTDRTLFSIGQALSEQMWSIRSFNNDTSLKVSNDDANVVSSSFKWNKGPAVYGISHDGTLDLSGTSFYYGEYLDTSLSTENLSAPGGNDEINTVQNEGESNYLGFEAGSNPDDFWDGQVAEILVYDRELSTAETNLIFDYLKNKWVFFGTGKTYVLWIPNP